MRLSPYLRLKQSKIRLRFDFWFQTLHFTCAEPETPRGWTTPYEFLVELNAWILVNYYDSFRETGNIDSEQIIVIFINAVIIIFIIVIIIT